MCVCSYYEPSQQSQASVDIINCFLCVCLWFFWLRSLFVSLLLNILHYIAWLKRSSPIHITSNTLNASWSSIQAEAIRICPLCVFHKHQMDPCTFSIIRCIPGYRSTIMSIDTSTVCNRYVFNVWSFEICWWWNESVIVVDTLLRR